MLSPVSFIDDRGLLLLQNYLRPPKSATAAHIVIETAMKMCQSHLTNPDQRPRRPPKLLQTKAALFSFGGLRGLWSRCVGCFWMQLFMVVPMTPSAAVADFGGRGRLRRPWPTSAAGDVADLSPSTFSYPWQLPTSMASLFLWPAINLLPVTTTPEIIVHWCRCHRRQSYCRCRRHRW